MDTAGDPRTVSEPATESTSSEKSAPIPIPVMVGFFAVMAMMGLQVSSLGPLLPSFRQAFTVGDAAAGLLAGGAPAGMLIGTVVCAIAGRWLGARALLVLTAVVFAVGYVGMATVGVWWLLVASAVTMGLAYGAGTLLISGLVARSYPRRASVLLNLLNGVFGLAAVIGPLVVSAVPAGAGRWVYLAYAVMAAACVFLFVALPGAVTYGRDKTAGPAIQLGRRANIRLGLFVLMFAAYIATEIATGAFVTTHLLAVPVDATTAVRATSLFFLGLAVGRLVAAPLGMRVAPGPMVAVAAILASGALVIAAVAPGSGWIYLLVGALMGPIFPTALAWAAVDQADRLNAMAIVLTGANAGGLALPPIVGSIIGIMGASVAPIPMAIAVGLCAALAGSLLLV